MFRTSHFVGLLLLAALVLPAQGQNKPPANRPQFRPAVLGSGPESLINRIDTNALLKAGQKDGAILFCASVAPNGEAISAWTYRAKPGTEAFEAELNRCLTGVKFTAPLYQYQPVGVLLYGTALFWETQKPHIQIFLNQDVKELTAATDFIAPQPVIGADSKFDGLTRPEASTVVMTAIVDLGLKVSREGELQDIRVIAEEPPLLGFAAAAVDDFRGAKFIPAFRSGDPTECEITQPICYKAGER